MECLLFIIVVSLLLLLYRGRISRESLRMQKGPKAGEPVRSAKCPYCKFTFEKTPQRNRKCPQCGLKIMLRKGRLLTEIQARGFDEKRIKQIANNLGFHRRRNLEELSRSGISKYVEISCANDGVTCGACRELHGKRVLVKHELQNPTLPVRDCTSDFCRCCYIPVVD